MSPAYPARSGGDRRHKDGRRGPASIWWPGDPGGPDGPPGVQEVS
jgi:hypothetical protein